MALYRIWYFTQNNRSEIARIKANNYLQAERFIMESNEFLDQSITENLDFNIDSDGEFGFIEWNDNEPSGCLEYSDDPEITEDNICESCMGCNVGFQIEEVEDPEPSDYEFKTVKGSNEYYDLTGEKPVKASDWAKDVSKHSDSQKQIYALILRTVKDKPELKKGFSQDLLDRATRETS